MATTVTDTGRANALSVASVFDALDGANVIWGWTEDSADYPNGDDVVERAAYHHFGTSTIPARPILTESFERNSEQLSVLSETINDRIVETQQNDISSGLRVIGQFAQSNMQRDFLRAQGELAQLSPSTVARKGHDLRLIETGHLRDQVRFKVDANG